MKSSRKQLLLAGVVVVLALAVAVLSKPGRSALERIFFGEKHDTLDATGSQIVQTAQDLEQRVRARHGWTSSLLNSVITGQVTLYNREGQARGQASFTLYRKYPDLTRVVIDRGGPVETIGFDHNQAWKLGTTSLTEREARDIRAWLRSWPERLFTLRDSGKGFSLAVGKSILMVWYLE